MRRWKLVGMARRTALADRLLELEGDRARRPHRGRQADRAKSAAGDHENLNRLVVSIDVEGRDRTVFDLQPIDAVDRSAHACPCRQAGCSALVSSSAPERVRS